MYSKKIVFIFFITSFVSAIFFWAVIFYYDPLKILHTPWKYTAYLQNNMRQQALSLIKYWKFDSVIIGTSMLENTSSKEASQYLGGKFINISLSGSDFSERKVVLDYVLKKKKIKKVLYSLDNIGIVDATALQSPFKLENWGYLYDENPWNDVKIYLNKKYLKCLFISRSKRRCMGKKVDFDRPNAWYHLENHANRYGGIDNWFKHSNEQIDNEYRKVLKIIQNIKKNKKIETQTIYTRQKEVKKYLDINLLSLIKNYPDTEFILVLPPYLRAQYAMDAQYNKDRFKIYLESVRYLVGQSQVYKNMHIYGWGDYDFLDDIRNYKDFEHYKYTINSWMLHKIDKKEGLLRKQNIDDYLAVFSQKALDYNFDYIYNKLDTYLKKQ